MRISYALFLGAVILLGRGGMAWLMFNATRSGRSAIGEPTDMGDRGQMRRIADAVLADRWLMYGSPILLIVAVLAFAVGY